MEVLNPALVVNISGSRIEVPAFSITSALEQLNKLSNEHLVDFGIQKIIPFSAGTNTLNDVLPCLSEATFYYSQKHENVFYSRQGAHTFDLSKKLLKDYQAIVGPVLELTTRRKRGSLGKRKRDTQTVDNNAEEAPAPKKITTENTIEPPQVLEAAPAAPIVEPVPQPATPAIAEEPVPEPPPKNIEAKENSEEVTMSAATFAEKLRDLPNFDSVCFLLQNNAKFIYRVMQRLRENNLPLFKALGKHVDVFHTLIYEPVPEGTPMLGPPNFVPDNFGVEELPEENIENDVDEPDEEEELLVAEPVVAKNVVAEPVTTETVVTDSVATENVADKVAEPVAEADEGKKPIEYVVIKTLTGKQFEVDFTDGDMLVEDLKKEIHKLEGIPVDQQRLIVAGKQMEDAKYVGDYGAITGEFVHLVLRLRGGMYHIASGYDDTTGEFYYKMVNFNGIELPVHPAWTVTELVDNVKEAFAAPSPKEVLCTKFQKTALALHAEELRARNSMVNSRINSLQRRRK